MDIKSYRQAGNRLVLNPLSHPRRRMQIDTVLTVLAAWFYTWSSLQYANNPLRGRTERERRSVLANYFKLLADIPISPLDAACRNLTQNVRYFPKPADIRDEIEGEVDTL